MKALEGKRALITGAARGIGAGIARSFAAAGAALFLHYRSDPAAAEALAAELRAAGSEVHLYRADLGKLEELDAMFDAIEREWGTLDAAVNNAGWDPGMVPLEEVTPEIYEKLTSVNIRGTLFASLREIALMKHNPSGGSIINIGSVQQETTVPGRTLYAMSKGAIHALTGELALEAGEFGIRVNNIPASSKWSGSRAHPPTTGKRWRRIFRSGGSASRKTSGHWRSSSPRRNPASSAATPSSPTAAFTGDLRGAATPSPALEGLCQPSNARTPVIPFRSRETSSVPEW